MRPPRVIVYGYSFRRLEDSQIAHQLAHMLELPNLPTLATDDTIENCLRGQREPWVFMHNDEYPASHTRVMCQVSNAKVIRYLRLNANIPVDRDFHFSMNGKPILLADLKVLLTAPS